MGRRRTIDRDQLLDAAEAVIAREGAAGLTIDAVAKEMGITKGGVQYCFGTKGSTRSSSAGARPTTACSKRWQGSSRRH